MSWPLSDDTNATMLLCTWLGGEQEHFPLEIQEYNRLASWLHQNDCRPGNLIDRTCAETASRETGLSYVRLSALLDRNINLGFYLEDWQRKDYWVVGRGDTAYPKRVRQSLRLDAPPVLFGMGEMKLLDQDSTAVIGPDQTIGQSREQARIMAGFCAEYHRTTIAAGKQIIASAVIENIISNGGSAVWVLQGPVFGEPLGKLFRRAKAAGKFVMLSSRSPADTRSIPQEPEVGRLAMALCDSSVYIDGTELSGDRYRLESAMYAVLGHRKCFVWCTDYPTVVAERLLQGGAYSWIDLENAIHEGLFDERTEISEEELSKESGTDPEVERTHSESQKSSDGTDGADEKRKPDAGKEGKRVADKEKGIRGETLKEYGTQLYLFKPIPGDGNENKKKSGSRSKKRQIADETELAHDEIPKEYGIQSSLF